MNYIGALETDSELINSNKEYLIYGGAGGYGEKIYRNMELYGKQGNVKAFIDREPARWGDTLHGIPVLSIERAKEEYREAVVCIGGEVEENIKDIELLQGMLNIHQIIFNRKCKMYGTEYGGFYLPESVVIKNAVVYSFGIGEELSFSEAIIKAGGKVFAFDPTPKAIKFVENHRLFSHPNFRFFPYGLSERDETEKFFLPKRKDWVSGSVILHRHVDDGNVVEVEMKTLRTIMRELGHDGIDILKMDIEGSEFKVMENIMDPSLETVNCEVILMETHERFFAPDDREYADKLYKTMGRGGFYDLHGTAKEPTFVKIDISD